MRTGLHKGAGRREERGRGGGGGGGRRGCKEGEERRDGITDNLANSVEEYLGT